MTLRRVELGADCSGLIILALARSELRELGSGHERLWDEDGLRLMETTDLHALGALANTMRQRKVGNRASYIVNRYINYSNYCILSCQFCAFARKRRDADGFELTVEQMVEKAKDALALGVTELHIVGVCIHPFHFPTDVGFLKASGVGWTAPIEVLHRH